MEVTNIKASLKIEVTKNLRDYYSLEWVANECDCLDLEYKQCPNFVLVERRPANHIFTFFRIGNKSSTLHVNLTGFKQTEELLQMMKFVQTFLKRKNEECSQLITKFQVDNISTKSRLYSEDLRTDFCVDFKVLREAILQTGKYHCRQNPERHSGLCVKQRLDCRISNPATAIIYRSGRVIVFGAKTIEQCQQITTDLTLIHAHICPLYTITSTTQKSA